MQCGGKDIIRASPNTLEITLLSSRRHIWENISRKENTRAVSASWLPRRGQPFQRSLVGPHFFQGKAQHQATPEWITARNSKDVPQGKASSLQVWTHLDNVPSIGFMFPRCGVGISTALEQGWISRKYNKATHASYIPVAITGSELGTEPREMPSHPGPAAVKTKGRSTCLPG